MFKIRQNLILDDKFRVTRYEEYQGDILMYWENLKYNVFGLLEKETKERIYNYSEYPHKIKILERPVAKYITINFTIGFTNKNLLASLD